MHPLKRLHIDLTAEGYELGTINVYMCVASQFLRSTKKHADFNRHDALDFLAALREKASKVTYIKLAASALRQLYKSAGCPFDVKIRDEVTPRELSRPTFTAKQIEKLIQGVKANCKPREQAFLAISTIYGVRKAELIQISAEDVSADSIQIWTKKKGDPRRHLLPPEIKPYITRYAWVDRVSSSGAGIIFKNMCKEAGVPAGRGYNWHGIRRSLVTELDRTGVSLIAYHNFMRWSSKQRGALAMPLVYAQYTDGEVDRMIFDKHPFLKIWGEKNGQSVES